MLKGFREFILRGNVVGLAVAVVIGTAFGAVVKALVADILTPLIAALVGQPNFSTLKFTINHSTFLYGDLVNTLITFLAVAAAVYFFVVLPLNRLAQRRAGGRRRPMNCRSLPPMSPYLPRSEICLRRDRCRPSTDGRDRPRADLGPSARFNRGVSGASSEMEVGRSAYHWRPHLGRERSRWAEGVRYSAINAAG
ncbi:MAG: large conductance mechanosensitive channel protein MscL [Candidatus Dormibacteria bacterium]